MRYIAALLLLSSCAAQAEDKPKAADDFSVFRVDLEVIRTNTEATNAKLEEIDSKLDALLAAPQAVPQISLPVPPAVDAPPAEQADRKTAGPTLNGKPLDVEVVISKHYRRMWTFPGTIDDHLVEHGVAGFEGLDDETKRKLHSAIHEQAVADKPVAQKPAALKPVVLPQNCPSGRCPTYPQQYGYQTRQRLFGRAWR